MDGRLIVCKKGFMGGWMEVLLEVVGDGCWMGRWERGRCILLCCYAKALVLDDIMQGGVNCESADELQTNRGRMEECL